MKVNLHFIHLYNDFSGSPRVLRDAIDATNSSLNVNKKVLYTSNNNGFLSNIANLDEVEFFYRRAKSRWIQIIYYLLSQVCLFFVVSRELLCCRKNGDDINNVVIVNTLLPFGGAIASKIFADRVIYYIHESHVAPSILKKFLRWIVELTSDDVIFVSNYLLNNEKYKNPNMDVIYNGLRSDFSIPSNIDFKSKFDSKIIVFSGSLKKYKGIDYLLELTSMLPDFNFVLILNCTIDEFDDYFEGVTLNNNITIEIRPDNIEEIYCKGFAIINLSIPRMWTETFGLSILEGMNYGCVPIAPNVGGPIEIVDNKCGLLSDPSELSSISNFLKLLSSDFNLWYTYSNSSMIKSKMFSSKCYQSNFINYIKTRVRS
ncbi:glycosyltransferase family 4 protein [Photobacterium aphoticum]|uniref:Glycosyl transferase family 1 domain-containing protein n=1 Tax=Photobacterium aphoticum TaxID=754436 RepID=A0A0J1GGL6_9GAMM|nr:glycosyltransferase family 4 protein [Photobacterium aphoticum]KLU98872.1 hypothetical protein ABT58_20220 [Photobacterium aphoticum]PSU56687.1 glycosyltransferase family 1 protein [Photobacterium aphoticum]GHA38905.1 hypothetical protein GCM10007086_10550 [Photobacterium aphoticum]